MINPVSGRGKEYTDTFARPSDGNIYANGDVIAATVSNTGTTPLRSLPVGFEAGQPFWINFARLATNLTTFLATMRVHLYKVADPGAAANGGTSLVGDNVAMVQTYANLYNTTATGIRIGHIDLPALVLQHAAGDDLVYATRDDVRLQVFPAAKQRDGLTESGLIYYRLEIITGVLTPSSGQLFSLTVRTSEN